MNTLLLAVCVSCSFIKIPGSLQLLSVVAPAGTAAAANKVLRCDAVVPMVMVHQRVFGDFRLLVVVVLIWCFSGWCAEGLEEDSKDNSYEDLGKQKSV